MFKSLFKSKTASISLDNLSKAAAIFSEVTHIEYEHHGKTTTMAFADRCTKELNITESDARRLFVSFLKSAPKRFSIANNRQKSNSRLLTVIRMMNETSLDLSVRQDRQAFYQQLIDAELARTMPGALDLYYTARSVNRYRL